MAPQSVRHADKAGHWHGWDMAHIIHEVYKGNGDCTEWLRRAGYPLNRAHSQSRVKWLEDVRC